VDGHRQLLCSIHEGNNGTVVTGLASYFVLCADSGSAHTVQMNIIVQYEYTIFEIFYRILA